MRTGTLTHLSSEIAPGDTAVMPRWWRFFRIVVPVAVRAAALALLGFGVIRLIAGPEPTQRMIGAVMVVASLPVFLAARPLTTLLFGSRW
jgi:hypothetical protein